MCRWIVYKGSSPILLSNLILEPNHSILTQSYDSRLRLDTRRPHNGDGFGIGYYTADSHAVTADSKQDSISVGTNHHNENDSSNSELGPEPCIFTSTIPAWNCVNLTRLAAKTTSKLIFAHVRATTEGNLSDQNCHPFSCGALMFMHNGGIGCFKKVKRKLAASLNDEWFVFVQGGTDSEWAFALFLDTLEKMGVHPLSIKQTYEGFGATLLRKAMLATIKKINAFVAEVGDDAESSPEDRKSLLNFAVTDGHSVVCTRYVSSRTDEAASLFFSSGTRWRACDEPTKSATNGNLEKQPARYKPSAQQAPGTKRYLMDRRDRTSETILVASEPLTFERDNWVTVPTNSILTIHNQTVMIHPIIDENWVEESGWVRERGFALAKGQVDAGAVAKTGPPPTGPMNTETDADKSKNLQVDMLRRRLEGIKAA